MTQILPVHQQLFLDYANVAAMPIDLASNLALEVPIAERLHLGVQLGDVALVLANLAIRIGHGAGQQIDLHRHQVQVPEVPRDVDALARHRPQGAAIGLATGLEPADALLLNLDLAVATVDRVDHLARVDQSLGRVLLFLVDLGRVDAVGKQVVRQHSLADHVAVLEHLGQHELASRQRIENTLLTAFDAPGDADLALASQQGDGAHLAQIHADRIVRLLERIRRCLSGVVFSFGRRLTAENLEAFFRLVVDQFDALSLE